jgi:tRNA threonylcarbamoyl adenosine modification protein (Sua5/YciO/YrdC/YwlC family)
MTRTFRTDDPVERERGLTMAASVVRRGGVVVLPVEATYAVATDPFSSAGIDRLLAAKGRARPVPIPVLVPSLATLDGLCHRTTDELKALARAFWPGPLTLIATAAPSLSWDVGTPGTVMVRVPLHPVALELLRRTGPLAATSGNTVGGVPPANVEDALAQLGNAVEVALDAGPRSPLPSSSIVDVTGATPVLVREGELSLERLRTVVPELVDGRS